MIKSNWGQQDSVSVVFVWSKYIPTARIEKIPAQLMHEDSHGGTQFAVIGYVCWVPLTKEMFGWRVCAASSCQLNKLNFTLIAAASFQWSA